MIDEVSYHNMCASSSWTHPVAMRESPWQNIIMDWTWPPRCAVNWPHCPTKRRDFRER